MTISPQLRFARQYLAAGLSAIPVRADGTKRPVESGWDRYGNERPSDADLVRWFGNGKVFGLGIPGGPASGNLSVLDFETADVYARWKALVPADTADALRLCPVVQTPSGAFHVYVRLSEPVRGTVLARDRDKDVLIEVRAHGEQALAPGCPASCHPSGKTYEWVERGWIDVPGSPTPMEAYLRWCEIAAGLTEWTPPAENAATRAPRPDRLNNDKEPGTDFNRRGTWEETGLFQVGWKWVHQDGADRGTIQRPGKDGAGVSATLGTTASTANGWPFFLPFTSNCEPFEPKTSYDRFGVFTRLKHQGDFAAATRALAGAGYGEPRAKDAKCTFGPTAKPSPSPERETTFQDDRPSESINRGNDEPEWPEPLAEEAYHGLAGEFVRLVEPHTEAHPVALLVSFILAIGNAVGRTVYALAEDFHLLSHNMPGTQQRPGVLPTPGHKVPLRREQRSTSTSVPTRLNSWRIAVDSR